MADNKTTDKQKKTNESSTENTTQTKQYDKDILVDAHGRHYSKDSLMRGIVRFTSFVGGGGIGDGLGTEINLDPSLFKYNPKGFDIPKACRYLTDNSSADTHHRCAEYVQKAIAAGGVNTDRRPEWAWHYVNFLPTIGFKHIATLHSPQTYNAIAGDIACYKRGTDSNYPGHICMFNGKQWISDFRQNSMYVYHSVPITAYVFRFVSASNKK